MVRLFIVSPVQWLNMAEMEFSLLARQCLSRRIKTAEELATLMTKRFAIVEVEQAVARGGKVARPTETGSGSRGPQRQSVPPP